MLDPQRQQVQPPGADGLGQGAHAATSSDRGRVGERVWLYLAAAGWPTGTAAEYTVVPGELAVPLPDEVGFDVGAALGVPAMTAHRALTVAEDGPRRLRPGALDGAVVLAAGGAGAVGHAVIQLARWAGANVISTVSGPEKARLAAAASAHHVVDYRRNIALSALGGCGALVLQSLLATFLLSYALQIGYDRSTVLTAQTVSSALHIATIPAFAALSDRIGRKPAMICGALASALAALPLFWLVNSGSATLLTLAYVLGNPML